MRARGVREGEALDVKVELQHLGGLAGKPLRETKMGLALPGHGFDLPDSDIVICEKAGAADSNQTERNQDPAETE